MLPIIIQMQRSTVNIKKLIAESDFGDIDELSKRWQCSQESSRLPDEPSFKQNLDSSNISDPPMTRQKQKEPKQVKSLKPTKQTKQVKPRGETLVETDYKKVLGGEKEREKKPNHALQYMDEDTQHFKVRLEHLLNVFKTDAVSEFMSMKRSMLDDQKEQVRSDTEKYLRLYEQKHKELIETRELLNSKSRECENLSIRCERMAKRIYQQKLRTQTFKCLSGPFMQLVKYTEYRKQKHKKMAMAERFRNDRLQRKGMVAWRDHDKECQSVKQQQNLERELEEVSNKYQKEILMLREKLGEATMKIEDYERNKHQLQDNLKKAFMKGVCAMNFEAMNALNTQGIQMSDPLLPSHESSFSEQSSMHEGSNRMGESNVRTQMSFGNPATVTMSDTYQGTLSNNMSSPQFGTTNKSVMFYKHPKIQSKQHNWKDAPVLNLQKQMIEIEEIQPINVVPERINDQQGRVIKVVNGKSSIVQGSGKKPPVVVSKGPGMSKRIN